jgi:hypothetical protein
MLKNLSKRQTPAGNIFLKLLQLLIGQITLNPALGHAQLLIMNLFHREDK